MAGLSDVQIINWALDMIPAKGITARTDSSESARSANRNYDTVLVKCLRRGLTPWSFATKRISLTANSNTPVNEFSSEYDLPGECVAIQDFWPKKVAYRKEGGKLYTNATTVILKYTSSEVLIKPHLMEYDFAEYFATELAATMTPRLCEDPNRSRALRQDAEAAFRRAASAFSMEDTPDVVPDGPWIDQHEGFGNLWNRSDALLDYDSIP